MRLEIGTKVKFLNDIGGGIVKGFSQDEIVLVETEDGFEMPVKVSDLIVAEPNVYSFDGEELPITSAEKQQNAPQKQPQITFVEKKYAEHKGSVLLALVPDNDKLLHVSNFGLNIVNDSNYYFSYVIISKDGPIATLVGKGDLEPDTKLEIHSYSQNTIAKIKEFRLQGIFYKHGLLDSVQPVDMSFNIENISFYKTGFFSENEYFRKKALILEKLPEFDLKEAVSKLEDKEIHKIAELKEEKPEKKKTKSPVNSDIEEVDLHIEELIDDHSGLSNGEIINIQLARFETALETALRSKTKKIVFIHGVGNGRLKQEIMKKLDRKYPDLNYQDASFKEYGFGATMVYLK